jgi:hypothetical protein
MGKGFVYTSQSGSSLVARLERNASITFGPIELKANWTFTNTTWIPQLSADLVLGVKSLLSLNVNSSSVDEYVYNFKIHFIYKPTKSVHHLQDLEAELRYTLSCIGLAFFWKFDFKINHR